VNTKDVNQAVQLMLASVPSPGEEAAVRRKAEILCDFATELNREFFARIGVTDIETIDSNCLANDLGGEVPDGKSFLADAFRSLTLNIPSSDLRTREDSDLHVEVVFCFTRVMLREKGSSRYRRPMTYEDAARYIVYFFAEQIMMMMRKNNWYDDLGDLFDKIERVFRRTDLPPGKIRYAILEGQSFHDHLEEMTVLVPGEDKYVMISGSDCPVLGAGYHADHIKDIVREGRCEHCGWVAERQ
jgi:hypothetical protein